MAAREDEGKRDDPAGKASQAEQPQDEGKAQSRALVPESLVRISIGIIILGGMTVGAFFLITDVIAPHLGPKQEETFTGSAVDEQLLPVVEAPGEQYVVEDIIVNPSGTRGKRFLRLGISLETKDGPTVLAELDSRRAQIRDLLIRKFSRRTLEELSDPTVREEIRLSCIEEINTNLLEGEIANLYFTDYVLQ
ncbi:MAG: flagellar basal body-associated FliL family protein [Candidatus Eisenbacteria sp.]|nr:flagellar basal body-associated FliL family protein [Candidatus Eisenbacteria bacterium]